MPWFIGMLLFFALAQTIYLLFHQHFLFQTMQNEFQFGLSIEQFVRDYGPVSIVSIANESFFYLLPFYGAITSVCLYAIFIWYREWVGKHSFIYRLLLLPINRMALLFSKITAIIFMLITVYAMQLALIPLHDKILQIRFPAPMVDEASTFFFINLFTPIWPIGYYDVHLLVIVKGFVSFSLFLFTMMTMILFERSFRIKGFFIACLYAAIILILYIGLSIALENVIYYSELIIVQITLCLLLIGTNIFLSNRLLHSHISA